MMNQLLRELLNRLERIGQSNEEIYDTECRDRMGDAILAGFVRQVPNYSMPNDFGLYDSEANKQVRQSLEDYINGANQLAAADGLSTIRQRLDAFQNGEVASDGERTYYDDFFGYFHPDAED